MAKKDTTASFIEKARKVHGDRFDYSKVDYANSFSKVCIIDKTNNKEFWQLPYIHLQGCGNPEDTNEKRKKSLRFSKEEFEEKAKKVHGDKYDYTKSDYINNKTKVCIICKTCGNAFWQLPMNHLKGAGCPICGHKTKRLDDVIVKSNVVHEFKYDYSKMDYRKMSEEVCIVCPQHGEFWQKMSDHIRGEGCPICGKRASKTEVEISKFIETLGFKTKARVRSILNGEEIDIYIPSAKLAIEYNGLLWHSDKFGKTRSYHLHKTEECEKQGIHLIHIFEDEWLEHKEIVLSKLKHILGMSKGEKVFARKCTTKEIDRQTTKAFLDANHIQGFALSTVYLGAYYKDELVGVMTFKKEQRNSDKWELTRFATDINKQCVGLGGKMFAYFKENYYFCEVKSFADRRWSTSLGENLYTRIGFALTEVLGPNYRYVMPGSKERHHKFKFRKQRLSKKYNLPLSMTENEMTQELGFYRIWDCGLLKYVFKN